VAVAEDGIDQELQEGRVHNLDQAAEGPVKVIVSSRMSTATAAAMGPGTPSNSDLASSTAEITVFVDQADHVPPEGTEVAIVELADGQ